MAVRRWLAAGLGPLLLALAGPMLCMGAPAALAEPASDPPGEPPLHIAADNVTGSHGPEGDIVMLNGNVVITRRKTVLTADAGRYLKAQGMLYLDGRVKMVDSLTTLTCEHASYSENEDRLFVTGNVRLVDRGAVLEAPAGTYDRATGRAELAGPVHGRDSTLTLRSDRAVYVRDSSRVEARDHVHGVDEKNRTEMDASAVDYDRDTKIAVATGEPVLRSRTDDNRVIELRAVRLVVDTERRTAEAIDSVRVSRDTLQARGEHALFDDVAQRGWLTGRPRAWDDQTTVTGDSLEFVTEKRMIKEVIVRPKAIMDYVGSRPSSIGEASRLTGDTVSVYFTHNDIDSLVAIGKAQNLYTAAPQSGRTAERNEASGDTITVFFRDRKIDRARVQGHAKGSYHLAVAVGDTIAAKKELVDYDAGRIEFQVPRNTIVLDQAAHLVYQDLELHSASVRYDVDKQTLVAEGKPVLGEHAEEVNGRLMSYDLGTRVGTIYEAETAYEKGIYRGDRIRKVGEDELDVMHGSYSTCNLAKPHYHFSARWMKIYLKDKLVAKPVVFYIENVPLLALPFWVFPVKPGRHSGFLFPQFEFGLNNQAGQFLRNAGYYWAPNDYMDLTGSGDYYQADPSWVLRGEGEYKLLYRLEGSFRGSFARDESPFNRSENWDFDAEHSQEISPRTRLVGRGSFVSSKNYNSSDRFGRSLSQRLNRFLTSSLALSHTADWATFNFILDRRQDLDADQTLLDAAAAATQPIGTLAQQANLTGSNPNISISFPTRAIGSLGLLQHTPLKNALRTMYLGLNGQYVASTQHQAYVAAHTLTSDSLRDSITTLGQFITTTRDFTANGSLTDSRQLFGWLNFQPSIRGLTTITSTRFRANGPGPSPFPTAGTPWIRNTSWSGGASMGTTLYGTFKPGVFGVQGLRHIVSPNLAASYTPVGGLGPLSWSLDQRFQAKIKKGDTVNRLDNLLSWTMAGTYDFHFRESGARHALSPISSNLFVQPPSYMNASLSWVTDLYNRHPVRALTYNLGINL
ncbi:MAG TPA: putative LPS assembly protein LptD, partial [Terriglobales bacterium]|nr:putative LPS assembly protein LptD [Terriglobales bacterium]